MLFCAILSIIGCCGSSDVSLNLDTAEGLMESRPDSALTILNSIQSSDLNGESQKARYALLRSMALDKNFIDKTDFDVLKPAIDYYLDNGNPDEQLRTYYYQGRIYQNRNVRDSALHSFMRGLDVAEDCEDSLTIARTLIAQGLLYKSFYDYEGYIGNCLKAGRIYRAKSLYDLEFDCLTSALNGVNIIKDKERADSIANLLTRFGDLDKAQRQLLHSLQMTYTYQFGSDEDMKILMENRTDSFDHDGNSILNIARAYHRLGHDIDAISHLDHLDESSVGYDTLKFLSLKFDILEGLNDYQKALAVYKDYVNRLETINSMKFEQKSQSMEERHRMELESERTAQRHSRTLWRLAGGIVGLLMVVMILMLTVRSNRIQKNLAREQARTTELENRSLKSENELTRQRMAMAELENKNLRSENELILEKARVAELKAENLTHRVETLQGESENLRELLQGKQEMPEEVRTAIQTRIKMLNSYLASQISDHKELEKAYDAWVAELTADTEEFMNSNRLAFQASHPAFIKYFEEHGLTVSEINYVCLYAIGLRGKDVGAYMKKRSHVNISSAIRKKLGIDKHETNIGIYVRKLLRDL